MRRAVGSALAVLALAAAAHAVDVAIVSFADGKLELTLEGRGAVTVSAQVDFKYISAKTDAESWARAVSEPLKVKLTGEAQPVTFEFLPPEGALVQVDVVVTVNGEEKVRESLYY
ncbi:MAG: hypothetical protein JSU81_04585 [Candidatus Coatesbacteria bacterium]|nr:MAG: hypothetical protein JSU81_04585 [Candidatus Coatesbacteria bacterium]